MIKKIIAITMLLLFAYVNTSTDTTTIIRIYEKDGLQLVDYEMDNNLYTGVYVEDL